MSVDRPDRGPVVSVRSASFGYAGRPVVSDLNLSMDAAEVVALLGPNGSGKSTVARGLLGLNDHLGGTVEILGRPLTRRSDRSRVGYVPQRHTLSGSVRSTVREVVATGRLPHRPWWRPAGRRDAELVDAALRTVGLTDQVRADVANLSGGQQRRVLIARALVGEPDLLIMDEPTAGVDAASQEVLAKVLRRLVDTGVTMLVVTHELAALHGVVDRVVEMDAGRVAFDGTPVEYGRHVEDIARAAHNVDVSVGQSHRHHGGGHHHDDDHDHAPAGDRAGLMRGPYDSPVGSTAHRGR